MMNVLILSRWQFAITTSFHFFFVPITLGLSLLLAIMETLHVITKKEHYLRMTRFWGKLFLINLAMGVVTGITLEFQFGMNWSEFSRFVGDIFGPPLAIESWVAFFLESVFIGVWIMGWGKVSPKVHAFSMWMVALGAVLSAFWILTANAFMQEPVGYTLRNNRIEMTDFKAILTNPQLYLEFFHAWFASISTTAFFMIGVSALQFLKKTKDPEVFKSSLRMAVVYGLIGILGVLGGGDAMAKHLVKAQPMKFAAAEGLWETTQNPGEAVFAIPDQKNRKNIIEMRIPYLLTLLAYGKFSGVIRGINDIQTENETKYGMDDYIPPVALLFWAFRIMVGSGFLMLFCLSGLFLWIIRNKFDFPSFVWIGLILMIPVPYMANITGWILTEVGRQPWVVYTLLKTREGLSNNVSGGYALASFLAFTSIYVVLSLTALYLMVKISWAGPDGPQGIGKKY